jgi:hypothetical protein
MKWHYSTQTDTHTLVTGGATISKNSIDYAVVSSLPAAKRKAAKMIREEQK